MKILVTGAAGFIGSAVMKRLKDMGETVVGLDAFNDYYDVRLKHRRAEAFGLTDLVSLNVEDAAGLHALMERERFDAVVHLAAQAGVRYSIEHPQSYMDSNLQGFLNVLEGCRRYPVRHLVYASSSSVYGLNGKVPFSEHDAIAHPVSLYAATKKANELMAHTYSHLYGIPTTGLRFFTVYGPWGRPDMSPFLFMDAILHHRPIKVYNHGDMWRDFTYIDDIVEGVVRILRVIPTGNPDWDALHPDPASSPAPYRIYNIGNQTPTRLMDYIATIERATGITAEKEFLPMQPGDVYQTYADSSALAAATGFRPQSTLEEGIGRTVEWFRAYEQI
jgi:UDP-glucuronate 4-epimerase